MRVKIAHILGAHGIRGEVKLRSFTETPEAVTAYGPLFSEDGARRFTLKITGKAGPALIAAVEGIHDRNAAEALKGVSLHVPAEALPELAEDEYYLSSLVGYEVFMATGGARAGVVVAVHDFGAGPLLEIALEGGETEFFPFNSATFPTVDREAKTLGFSPPEVV